MKPFLFLAFFSMVLGLVLPAVGAEFEFHGDLDNRFLVYTNRQDWLTPERGTINDGSVDENYGELKYRFWFEAATNDGDVRGVYAIEIGGIRFGERDQGGSFSGDGVNVESRWAYLDLQTPGVASQSRWQLGLQPFSVNDFIWEETAAGVIYSGAPIERLSYRLGWIRGVDELNSTSDIDIQDNDNWLLRLDFHLAADTRLGLFGLYQYGDPDDTTLAVGSDDNKIFSRDWQVKKFAGKVDFDVITLGVDGGSTFGDWFVNWDLMYQNGSFDNVQFVDGFFDSDAGANNPEFSRTETAQRDFDLSAYFFGLEGGVRLGKNKFTGTFWYASGDDNPEDGDFDAFLATDLDRDDAIGVFQGLYTSDETYFTEKPYVLDKGFVMLKGAFDHQYSERFSFGGALMYMLTAEDIDYSNSAGTQRFSNSDIGFEVDVYARYMLYTNVELALNFGYLFAGDALDAFEVDAIRDGSSDEDIFGSSFRIRYTF